MRSDLPPEASPHGSVGAGGQDAVCRIRARGVSKVYRRYDSAWMRVAGAIGLARLSEDRIVHVLRDVSLEVAAGESLGIMGPNGAGKSTLLRILTGALFPSSGEVEVAGRVTLLDLGCGLNRELSGRDNLWSLGTALGMPAAELGRRLDEIVEFSELGAAIAAPVKSYSTGMAMRLAFSLYAHTDPDVLVIDEAFAVGDARFVLKCTRKLRELLSRGAAILLASHDGNAIAQLCDRAVVIHEGRMVFEGNPVSAVDSYYTVLGISRRGEAPTLDRTPPAQVPSSAEAFLATALRRPERETESGEVRILGLRILRGDKPSAGAFQHGDPCRIEWLVRTRRRIECFTTGVHLHDEFGTYVFGTSYVHLGRPLELPEPGHYVFSIAFSLEIGPGRYIVSLGAAEPDLDRHAVGGNQLDRYRDATVLEVLPFELAEREPTPFLGLVRLPAEARDPIRLDTEDA